MTVNFGMSQTMAQPEASPELERQAKIEVQKLAGELGLSDKQALLFEKNLISYTIKTDAVADNNDLTVREKRQQINALEKDRLLSVRDILTQPQYRLYLNSLRKERKMRRMKRKAKRRQQNMDDSQ